MIPTAWISGASALVTAIGGFVAYIVKTNSAQNTRLTIVEATAKALNDANLNTRVSVVEQGLQEIKSKVAKLDLLESVKATLDFLSGQMRDIRIEMVPRAEHQAYWKAIDDKINVLPCRGHNDCVETGLFNPLTKG